MDRFAIYSIVRFRPFPETGEFANVGIIALERPSGALRFKLVPKRYRRVTQFFNNLDANTFSDSISILEEEIRHMARQSVERRSSDFAFKEFIRRDQEAVWVFSEARTVRYVGDFDDAIDRLYELYIGRNFINSEYSEQFMARHVRQFLRRRGIDTYSERLVDDEIVPVKFPLVSGVTTLHVIKPLSLGQKTTIGIIDHAATWHDRLRLLISRGKLRKENVLLPLMGPTSTEPAIGEAYLTARSELESLGVQIVDSDNESAIVEFARRGAPLDFGVLH
jgi:hypothetical protein